MIGIQEHPTWVQHLWKRDVERGQLSRAEPVESRRADGRVEPLRPQLLSPSRISQVKVHKTHPLAVPVGIPAKA